MKDFKFFPRPQDAEKDEKKVENVEKKTIDKVKKKKEFISKQNQDELDK